MRELQFSARSRIAVGVLFSLCEERPDVMFRMLKAGMLKQVHECVDGLAWEMVRVLVCDDLLNDAGGSKLYTFAC